MQFYSLDQLLASDHRARSVWKYVETLDIEPLYREFKAVEGEAGRPPIAPEVLLGLWLLATLDSISSARELARRCETDIAYKWMCGCVSVNYHTLSDFRTHHPEFFEKMLTDSVTVMLQAGVVTLETIAQDGMRVRANAGGSSFRRKPRLEELHEHAQQHVEQLRRESEDEGERQASDARRQAARERSAREKAERLADAVEQVRQLEAEKEERKKGDGDKARCSTTDPDARQMKMGDSGYRPAYNFQFATDAKARVIVAVEVTNSGSDRGEMAPMHEKVVETYGVTPQQQLVDSAFVTVEDVTHVEQAGTQVFSTIRDEAGMRKRGKDPYARARRDTDESYEFRKRMSTPEAQTIYKQRPSVAEFANAECRNRGCQRLLVRGLEKVKSVALLYALTFNLLRMWNLKMA
jgi:transposase